MNALFEEALIERRASQRADPPSAAALQVLNPLQMRDWDELLIPHRDASLFHTRAWAEVLHHTYGHEPYYLGRVDNGRLAVLLPIMEVNSVITGRRGVSLPFTDECLPLGVREPAYPPLFERAIDEGRTRKWKYLELRGAGGPLQGSSSSGSFDTNGAHGSREGRNREQQTTNVPNPSTLDPQPSTGFYGHTLDLSDGPDAVFQRFDGSVRRAIRKAEAVGVHTDIGSSFKDVEVYYGLHCKTRRRHGLPPQPFEFFANLHQHVLARDLGFIVTARHQERPIAGAVFFHFAGKAIYKYGASDYRYQELRGNNVVMWAGIRHGCERACQQLHLGRTSLDNQGLRRYKLGFGAAENSICYFRFDLATDRYVPMPDNSGHWTSRLFRGMPLVALRLMGRLLYRHMS